MKRWDLAVALLLGIVLGLLWRTPAVEAQAPRLLFVSSSTGAVPAVGGTDGVLTVAVQ
jgi:hypothetical protein